MLTKESLFARITDTVVTYMAYLASIILVVLMFITTADVIGRYFFNQPLTGVFDLTHFAVLIMVFFGLAYCGIKGGHVAIELLYDKLDQPIAKVLDQLINLVGALLFMVIAWRTVIQSLDIIEFKESSQLLLIPYYPFYWLVSFGCVMFAIVMFLRIFVPEKKVETLN
jgi:TRAP-type C4-dicarboxylate transport system permease small subunit